MSSIKNMNLFKVKDEATGETCYGFNQEWYPTRWQRLSGCGPTTASNIIYYLDVSRSGMQLETTPVAKSQCLKLMEKIWRYVTPTFHGVNTTKILYDGTLAYAKANAINLNHAFIDIPGKKGLRPDFRQVLSFINDALNNDLPVAFLNLHHGEEKLLYSWHWVTIVALEYSEDGSYAIATIMDDGKIFKINLALWFSTTNLGGGFVSFRPE